MNSVLILPYLVIVLLALSSSDFPLLFRQLQRARLNYALGDAQNMCAQANLGSVLNIIAAQMLKCRGHLLTLNSGKGYYALLAQL